MQVKMFTSSNPYQPICKSSSIPDWKHILDQSQNPSVTTSAHFAVTTEISRSLDLNFCFSCNILSFYTQTYHSPPYLQYYSNLAYRQETIQMYEKIFYFTLNGLISQHLFKHRTSLAYHLQLRNDTMQHSTGYRGRRGSNGYLLLKVISS